VFWAHLEDCAGADGLCAFRYGCRVSSHGLTGLFEIFDRVENSVWYFWGLPLGVFTLHVV